MRVLVTGANGFSGRYLVNNFVDHGLVVMKLESDLINADAVLAEVKELQPQAVVHLASISNIQHVNTSAFYEINLLGTKNLLDSLLHCTKQIQSVLLASSANIYGNRSNGALSENMPPDPINDYAVSKLAMEHMARLYLSDLPLFITRPFNYTGPGQRQDFIIPKIVEHFVKRLKSIEMGNINVSREFGDVRDIVEIYRQLLLTKPIGRTINICTGRAYSLAQILDICSDITGHEIEVKVKREFVRENEVKMLKGERKLLDKLLKNVCQRDIHDTLEFMLKYTQIPIR